MSSQQFVPRRPTMTLGELFEYGPWRSVLLWWIAGAIVLALWLTWPASRIAAVTTPLLSAALLAAIFGMAAAIARAPYVHGRGAGRLIVTASMIAGAAAGYGLSSALFHAMLARGCECAPLVATRESSIGVAASYALPLIAFLVWCRWGFAGLRGVGGDYNATRIVDFSQQFMIRLPLRVLSTVTLLLAAFFLIWSRVLIADDLPPTDMIQRLHTNDAAAVIAAKTPGRMDSIEVLRQSQMRAAQERLARFDFDGARPLVYEAACKLVMPETTREAEIAATEEAFEQLDGELKNGFATWRPSAISGRTVLALLPMNASDGSLRLPFMWSSQPRRASEFAPATLSSGRVNGKYRGEIIVDAWLFTLSGNGRSTNAAVALKLLGTSGLDAELPEILSRRLGRAPAGGVGALGSGAMCAMWTFGEVTVRLGPAVTSDDPSPTPSSPVWLTYYDAKLLRACPYALPPELAATYDCGDAHPQSH